MKERPILMSAPMVLATLREIDPKLQTRRVVKMNSHHQIEQRDDGTNWPWMYDGDRDADSWMTCPYGQPGDLLWVRETFFAWGRWETRFSAKKGRDEWHFIDMTMESGMAYLYAASGEQPQPMGGKRHLGGVTPKWWKRPAIHMPRVASRITLEVTGVRVERLQDISEADALAEGVRLLGSGQMWTAGGVYDAHFTIPSLSAHSAGCGRASTVPAHGMQTPGSGRSSSNDWSSHEPPAQVTSVCHHDPRRDACQSDRTLATAKAHA